MKPKHSFVKAVAAAALALSTLAPALPARAADDDAAPTLMLDKNPKIVAYQLKRHTNAQLVAIERNADDPKFRPVYEAILTRKGVEKKYREESAAAIAKIDKSDPAVALLDAIAKVDAEDNATPRELAGLLMAQKPQALAAQREKLTALAKESESATVKQAAYAALAVADGKPDGVWQLATDNAGVRPLLAGVAIMPAGLRPAFYAKVRELAERAPDDATQVAALDAISSIPGKEAEAFKLLADVAQAQAGEKQAAAVRSVGRIPPSKWPKDQVEPLVAAIVKLVGDTPAADRTKPAMVQAVQLGNDLAAALGAEKAAPIRKRLRDLAPRVVLIRTLTEQMMYDLHYFTVEAGKPVQVILENTDNMPHNVVIVAPGQLAPIALAAGAMGPPADPAEKAFVPNDPKVLQATHLVDPGNAEALSFDAPAKPGSYPFLCTYPGHSVKMYGVMQVVADLDKYDQNPTPPNDPQKFPREPYKSPKNEGAGEPGAHEAHQH